MATLSTAWASRTGPLHRPSPPPAPPHIPARGGRPPGGGIRSPARCRSAGSDLAGLAHALRAWALADPQRYFLIYGTPVPGYHAPEDTTAISAEIMTTLLDACMAPAPPAPATPFTAHLAEHREWAGGHPAPPEALHRFLAVWTRLHGVLSLELAGHFAAMGFDPALLFAAELDNLRAHGS
ncbi:TetR-like C-terminal domain-containing protein [Streptomyces sp. NPDC048269]|uniref:TetR-like C-terminal domain-containing protein n=1 Tax=Streptomyces sp. NPDC048269 TaxID=3155753 RepID=UPI00343C4C2E